MITKKFEHQGHELETELRKTLGRLLDIIHDIEAKPNWSTVTMIKEAAEFLQLDYEEMEELMWVIEAAINEKKDEHFKVQLMERATGYIIGSVADDSTFEKAVDSARLMLIAAEAHPDNELKFVAHIRDSKGKLLFDGFRKDLPNLKGCQVKEEK